MRCIFWLLVCGMLLSGCAMFRNKDNSQKINASPKSSSYDGKMIVTPDQTRTGRVVRVNENARFAVLNFPIGTVPPIGQFLGAYRRGLKVGELKVTGPQGDENTVADITRGDVAAGDEVRSQ